MTDSSRISLPHGRGSLLSFSRASIVVCSTSIASNRYALMRKFKPLPRLHPEEEFSAMTPIHSTLRNLFSVGLTLLIMTSSLFAAGEEEDGFVSLFNGKDMTHWTVPDGDGGKWKVVDGVIDYNADSQAKGDRNLWSEKEYGDFILKIDWRIKETSGLYDVPIVLEDGSYLTDPAGKKLTIKRENADSGIYVRGTSKAQLNIWCWPIGSGEVYGYRNNQKDPEIRAGVTPKINADKPVGEWNHFEIIVIGDRLTVISNNHMVLENAFLPDLPAKGRIALQHHGGKNADGSYKPASSLVQFRNIWIKELSK